MDKINYAEQTQILLDFDKLILELEQFFISDYSKTIFSQNLFKSTPSEVEKRYKQIGEFQVLKNQNPNFPIQTVEDFSEHLAMLHIENYFMDSGSILKLKKLIENIREIKEFFKSSTLQKELVTLIDLSNSIFYDSGIIREIDKIVDEKGEVKSSASKELQTIRKRKSELFGSIDKAFVGVMNRVKQQGFLNEIGETIRNGRRVLAVNAEHKRSVKGLIIDESETGRITFIEPNETIFLNNEASEIDRDEQREICKILIELTKYISKYSKLISQYQAHMVEWDTIQAKHRWMYYIQGSIPKLTHQIKLIKASHPLLKIKNMKEDKSIVPFDLSLDQHHNMLMISGPNAGGKSITMKTIGLTALMIQNSIPIVANGGSEFPYFSQVIGDIGDLQSIQNELSTYSSKLVLWNYMMKVQSKDTLLLFDELGDGTDPSFGASMARVVLEKCLDKKMKIIATTHYSDLKKFCESRQDILNANMLFDSVKLEPLYQLSIGLPGSSYTFHIALKMGLDKELINRAESLSNQDQIKYDKQLFHLEKKEKELFRQKQEVEKNEREVKRQMKDWNRLHLDLDLTRKKIKFDKMLASQENLRQKEDELKAYKDELKKKRQEEIIAEQKKLEEERKLEAEKTKDLYKQIHQVDPNQVLNIGDKVKYIQTDTIGIVEKLDKKKAIVVFDNLKSTILLSDLILVKDELNQTRSKVKKLITLDTHSSRELDLRGKYVFEALPEIDEMINRALMNNYMDFKIIHGKGKLKTDVISALRKYKQISKFEHPLPENGGDGATIVYF